MVRKNTPFRGLKRCFQSFFVYSFVFPIHFRNVRRPPKMSCACVLAESTILTLFCYRSLNTTSISRVGKLRLKPLRAIPYFLLKYFLRTRIKYFVVACSAGCLHICACKLQKKGSEFKIESYLLIYNNMWVVAAASYEQVHYLRKCSAGVCLGHFY